MYFYKNSILWTIRDDHDLRVQLKFRLLLFFLSLRKLTSRGLLIWWVVLCTLQQWSIIMLRDKILKIPQLAVRPWIYKTLRKILNFPHLARKILNYQHLAAKFLILLKEDPNSWKCFENKTQSLQQRAWIKPPCETHFKRGET